MFALLNSKNSCVFKFPWMYNIVNSFSGRSKSKWVMEGKQEAYGVTSSNETSFSNSEELDEVTTQLTYSNPVCAVAEDSDFSVQRIFEKSSTHNAVTMPLKLPRLANPFPEPVKSRPSDTVSDEEKARVMHEELKMEAQFQLQDCQETNILTTYLQHLHKNKNKSGNAQSMNKQNYKRLDQKQKGYVDVTDADTGEHKNKSLKTNFKKLNRSARGSRGGHRQINFDNQTRKYSTNKNLILEPVVLTEVEQCDIIMERLKSLYPEYANFKKPIFIPGSQEEKKYIEETFKLIGKHKQEVKKQSAPFPSYSEVRTFVYNSNDQHPLIRYPKISLEKDNTNAEYKNFSVPEEIDYLEDFNTKNTKTEAPYQSYSETTEEYNEEEYDVHPWKVDVGSIYKDLTDNNKKQFSTSTNLDVELKKKKPCKSPFDPNIPVCDYEGTARKRDKQKRHRRNPPKPSKKASTQLIQKIRQWLKTYRSDADDIRINQSETDIDGCQAFIIEVDDSADSLLDTIKNSQYTHAVEMENGYLVEAKNIPDFFCGCGKAPSGGCKQTTKKPKKKKKCRQYKKRKLPSCDDVPKKKDAKPFPISGFTETFQPSINVQAKTYAQQVDNNTNLSLKSSQFDALLRHEFINKNNFEPFKLKPEFWKK